MLTFELWLTEELSGVNLVPKKNHPDSNQHEWSLHHHVHGHLGSVIVGSTDNRPMNHAASASMNIQTTHNQSAADVGGIDRHTNSGPHYDLGYTQTNNLIRQLKSHYPNLKKIEKSMRTTGARSNSLKSASLNLSRLKTARSTNFQK